MKYLFVVQGEGRGHLTQAIALSHILRKNGHEVVEVLVGKCFNREIPQFFMEKIGCRVRSFDSPTFSYKKGGKKSSIAATIFRNCTPVKIKRWQKSLKLINRRVLKTEPDVIINFYEILVGVTNIRYRFTAPVVSIAHQFMVDHPKYVQHSTSEQGYFLLRLNNMLCSFGTTKTLALSLYKLKDSYKDRIAVVPPLLRDDIFKLTPKDNGYILGYMLNPAYLDEIIAWNKNNPSQKLQLFWDKKGAPEVLKHNEDITIHKISDTKFLSYMEGCSGYVTTAGFESVCEALYLGKPILMIPAHLEQEINGAEAAAVGAGIISGSFDISKLTDYIPNYNNDNSAFRNWVDSAEELFVRHLTTLV